MKEIQYKAFSGIELKANLEKRTMEGYASVFGNIDSHRDIILPSAFNKSVADWKASNPRKRRIKVLYQHQRLEPIGIPTDLLPDKKGLYTHSVISLTDVGEKTLILARDGVLNEMSVGFIPIKENYSEEKRANLMSELMLMEYSPVTWGSNELTTIDNVKHMINDYAYSKGNVLDILVETLIEKVKALSVVNEPSKDTQIITTSKSLDDNKDDEIVKGLLLEIQKMKKE